jgi:hypothetical protein
VDTPPDELLSAVQEIRNLIRIMAEPAIAEHDKKARIELRRLVGSSAKKAKAVFLMDGSRIQSVIQKETSINLKSKNNGLLVTYAVNLSPKGKMLINA